MPPTPLRVAIVVFDGFSELDTFVTFGLLNRLSAAGWKAELVAPTARVTSMNGVTVDTPQPLEFANEAAAVVFAGGLYTRAIAENSAVIDRLALDPLRQLIGGQCSGTLLLARLGLLADVPAATDTASKPWMIQAGVRVADDTPFHARGPVATAGGPLAAHYLATWLMWRAAGLDQATQALNQAAPVGLRQDWTDRLLSVVRPFVPDR
ncbi:DJ-1/PfpI family protein [Rhizobacter sp. Root1221]|uniref:DJ-1/PfpI family protein n=1 Tax=Rhizobacter sp. Root1221 TaxID=1736433 RepID=UPI000AC7D4D9|nr:DJ-1/PfpI family protein [Rhizobacter sp. Root1221]